MHGVSHMLHIKVVPKMDILEAMASKVSAHRSAADQVLNSNGPDPEIGDANSPFKALRTQCKEVFQAALPAVRNGRDSCKCGNRPCPGSRM